MSINLTPELRQALSSNPGQIVELVDDQSTARYIVVPVERFRELQALLSTDDFDISETYAAQSQALGLAGWDDPAMDIYNDYDANRP
jgi:bifunctional DNA-binding transcriptional regulator/antitoxin component of YhaV-PrlF toxin-antitoxin module